MPHVAAAVGRRKHSIYTRTVCRRQSVRSGPVGPVRSVQGSTHITYTQYPRSTVKELSYCIISCVGCKRSLSLIVRIGAAAAQKPSRAVRTRSSRHQEVSAGRQTGDRRQAECQCSTRRDSNVYLQPRAGSAGQHRRAASTARPHLSSGRVRRVRSIAAADAISRRVNLPAAICLPASARRDATLRSSPLVSRPIVAAAAAEQQTA